MGLIDKTDHEKELERENRLLKEMLAKQMAKKATPQKVKKVMYQCRYCGYKSVRNATDGAPMTTAHCPRHPRGWCKGVHSWMRTYL